MPDYTIREARDDADRHAAYRLRYDLYVTTQGLFGDVADHEGKMLRDEVDDHAMLFVAEHEGEIIGTARVHWGGEGRFSRDDRETFDTELFRDLVDESELAIGTRLLVRADHRASPVLALFICHMYGVLAMRGTEALLADCEPHLVNRWSRIGFRPFGLCEHPTNGTLVRLAIIIGDTKYLRSIKSPLGALADKWTKTGFAPRRLATRLAKSQRIVSEAKDSELFWAAVEDTLSLEKLAAVLGGLSVDELDALLASSHALDCDPGSALIRKGHASRTLYVLLTGGLEVWDEGQQVASVDTAGAVLGEVALFAGAERMSDVIAGPEGARVLALSERSIKRLIEAQGAGAAKFLLTLTRDLSRKLHERKRPPQG